MFSLAPAHVSALVSLPYLDLNPKLRAELYREKFEKLLRKQYQQSLAVLFGLLFILKYR